MKHILSKVQGKSAFLASGLILVLVVIAAATGVWVFREPRGIQADSPWRFLLQDRTTAGFVRAAVVMGAVYVIASVAALIVSGRWLKSMAPGGFEADDPKIVDSSLESLRRELRATQEQRDEWKRLFWRKIDG